MPELVPNWHPMFVHLSIGILTASVMLYVATLFVSAGAPARNLRLAARINLWLGVLATVGTVLTGWYAYATVAHDDVSHTVMTTHRNWALFTATLFALLALWAFWLRRRDRREGAVFVLAMVVAAAPMTVTGFYGGELVYRHGTGVLSLPDGDDHAHDDGDDHQDSHHDAGDEHDHGAGGDGHH